MINLIDRLSNTAVLVGALVAILATAAAINAVVPARPSQSHESSEPNPVGYFNVGCVSDRNPAGGFRMSFENRMPADQAQDFVTAECPEFAVGDATYRAGWTDDAGYIVRNGVVEEVPTPDAGEFMATLRRLADADSLDPAATAPRESTPETLPA